jgi:hypothetical protein
VVGSHEAINNFRKLKEAKIPHKCLDFKTDCFLSFIFQILNEDAQMISRPREE